METVNMEKKQELYHMHTMSVEGRHCCACRGQDRQRQGESKVMVHNRRTFQQRQLHSRRLSAPKLTHWYPVWQHRTIYHIAWMTMLHLLSFAGRADGNSSSPSSSCTLTNDGYSGFYIPNARTAEDSNTYSKHQTNSVETCQQLCCSRSNCDLIWIVDDTCYTVTCGSKKQCEPVKATKAKFASSYMAFIQRTNHQQGDSTHTHSSTSGAKHGSSVASPGMRCNIRSLQSQCPENEVCTVDESTPHSRCACIKDYFRDDVTKQCTALREYLSKSTNEKIVSPVADASYYARPNFRPKAEDSRANYFYTDAPEQADTGDEYSNSQLDDSILDNLHTCYGNDECTFPHQICMHTNKLSMGLCGCVTGYTLDFNSGLCKATTLPPQDLTTAKLMTKSKMGPAEQQHHLGNQNQERASQTPVPAITVTTPQHSSSDHYETTTHRSRSSKQPGNDDGGGSGDGVDSAIFVGVLEKKNGIKLEKGRDESVARPQSSTSDHSETTTHNSRSSKQPVTTQSDVATDEPALTDEQPRIDNATKTTDADKRNQINKPVVNISSNASSNGSSEVPAPQPTTAVQPTSQVTLPMKQLSVSVGDNKELTLPDKNSVNLFASVSPATQPNGKKYEFEWHLLPSSRYDEENNAEMTGKHSQKLQLTKLVAGQYNFQVDVTGEHSKGSAFVNVTVHLPPRINTPPVAVIQPDSQEVTLPSKDTILDGSHSLDDDAIIKYHWEEVEGPLRKSEEQKISGDDSTVTINNLLPGFYIIKLTVTDSDGVTDFSFANITVREETDYPPEANAGPDKIVKLPSDSVVLYGNSSTDDHGIVSWEWSKESKGLADMKGSGTNVLHLTDLEEGNYVFKLTVTDVKGQSSVDKVTVIVKPVNNQAPIADAGPDKELTLPDDIPITTTLDGTASTDDQAVVSYAWMFVSGPSPPTITNSDQAIATVSGLQGGEYVFRLTVTDAQSEKSTDDITVMAKKEVNQPPKAVAGPDITLELPSNFVELDGSQSTDDMGIVSYHWTRSLDSLAAGVVLAGSQRKPKLQLVYLVAGTYHFVLNVTDAKGASSIDKVSVIVKEDSKRLNLVEMTFDVDVTKFTEQNRIDLIRPLAVMLSVKDEDIIVQHVSQSSTGRLKVVFYVVNETSHKAIPGPTVAKRLLSEHITSQHGLLKFAVLSVDTVVCQLNCSNHGYCDRHLKKCICESFWMQDIFRLHFGDGESNCDWSILYVIIISFVGAVALGAFIWFFAWCCIRRRKRVKRRRRYNLLSEEMDTQETLEMLPKANNGKQSSSIMISESDEDTDEETTLFDNKKRSGKNGKSANGVISNSRRKRPFALNRTEKL